MQLIRLMRFVWSHPLNKAYQLQSLSRVFRWQIASRVLPEAIFGVPFVNDSRLFMQNGMTGATGNWYCGLDELNDMGIVLHTLRTGDLFLDVGANIGSYTVLAAAGTGANVIAIEPIRQTFSNLVANVRLNGLEDRVKACCMGLSHSKGKLSFTITQDTVNHVLAEGEDAACEEILVNMMDDIIGEKETPTVIKIDVEGHELAVLNGAEKTLSSPKLLAVIMEINGSGARYGVSDQQLISKMTEHGFEAHRYCAINREVISNETEEMTSGNTIFLRNIKEIKERVKSAPKTKLINGWI